MQREGVRDKGQKDLEKLRRIDMRRERDHRCFSFSRTHIWLALELVFFFAAARVPSPALLIQRTVNNSDRDTTVSWSLQRWRGEGRWCYYLGFFVMVPLLRGHGQCVPCSLFSVSPARVAQHPSSLMQQRMITYYMQCPMLSHGSCGTIVIIHEGG